MYRRAIYSTGRIKARSKGYRSAYLIVYVVKCQITMDLVGSPRGFVTRINRDRNLMVHSSKRKFFFIIIFYYLNFFINYSILLLL